MTTLIQQKSGNDCGLASIAMARQAQRWEDVWTQADLDELIKSNGMSDIDKYMKKAGFIQGEDYKIVYLFNRLESEKIQDMLWQRRAVLSVASFCEPQNNHMIYWDGQRVWDPLEGREGKIAVRYIRSTSVSQVILLKG